jgi:hypothetical protein
MWKLENIEVKMHWVPKQNFHTTKKNRMCINYITKMSTYKRRHLVQELQKMKIHPIKKHKLVH